MPIHIHTRQNECPHKELLLSCYIVKDKIGGGEFHLCPKCFRKIKHLTGYEVIQRGEVLQTIIPKKLNTDCPF